VALPVAILTGAGAPSSTSWGAVVALALGIRSALAVRFGNPAWTVLATPVAVALMIGIQLHSFARHATGRPVVWRTRRYSSATQGKGWRLARAIVGGAGLGGLSAAIRLAAAGWQVSVYEKNGQPGGRMSTVSAGGYTWDAGPTLIMMPEVLRELFEAAGRRLEDYGELRPVDPYSRVACQEGGHLDFSGHLPTMLANLEAVEPGAGAQYLRFLARAEQLARVTRTSIIGRAYDGPRDLRSLSVLMSLLRARPFASVASIVAA